MQKNKNREFLGSIVLLIWSTISLVLFIRFPGSLSYVQGASLDDFAILPEKLSQVPFLTYLLDTLVAFIGMAFFGASSVSLGMKLTNIFGLDEHIKNNSQVRISVLLSTYLLIGNAVFSLIFSALASVSHLSATYSVILMGLGLLFGLAHFRELPISTSRLNAGHGKILIVLSVAILTVSIFQSAARLSWDASAVYFSSAKLTALEHQVEYYTVSSFVISTLHSTIQYSAVMQVFGDQSARMISWLFGVVNISVALALAELIGTSKKSQYILPALILTSTAFLDLMGDGKVELLSSAYSLIAVYWMVFKARDSHQIQILYLLSGFFIGIACILRPYNVFLLGVFVFIHSVQQFLTRQLSVSQFVQRMAWMALGAIGFALYHFLLNKIILGSPFAFWASVTNMNPTNGPWDFNPKTIWMHRSLYPFVVTYRNNGASLGNITPLVVAFLPALAASDIRKKINIQKQAVQLTISAGITLLSWVILFFSIVEVRYVMFLWIILFIPVAEIITSALETNSLLIRNTAKWGTVFLMVFIFVRSVYISLSTYSPVDHKNNPQCSDSVLCNHLAPINKIANEGERVLTLSAYRYYLRNDLFACSTTAEEYRELRELSYTDIEAFWREVYRMGYSYVAYENNYAEGHLRFSYAPFSNPPKWVNLSTIIITSSEWKIVSYRLNNNNPPVNIETVCRQDESGIWRLQSQ